MFMIELSFPPVSLLPTMNSHCILSNHLSFTVSQFLIFPFWHQLITFNQHFKPHEIFNIAIVILFLLFLQVFCFHYSYSSLLLKIPLNLL